jgi:small redox-active disulfide protein 2
MLTIKVLGSGCENCKRLAWLAERAAQHLGVEAQVVKVTDYTEILKYDVLTTPGLVIDEKLVSSGRIPGEAEIVTFLTDALQTASS